MATRKLKFYWTATEEELRTLQKLAKATGHANIRDLFGTLVNSGLESLLKLLQQQPAGDTQNKEPESEANVPAAP